MTHKRSRLELKRRSDKDAKEREDVFQRREAARIVNRYGYHDPPDLHKGETVNLLTPGQIALHLQEKLGTFDPEVASRYDWAEVVADPYAEGTNQQIGAVV